MNAADDLVDVEQQYQSEDDEHELREQVGERKHQVENTRFLDPDDVDGEQQCNENDRGHDVSGLVGSQWIQKGNVLAEEPEIARCEVSGDRHRRGVVEELHPTDDVADGGVEGAPGEARAAAGVG